MILFLYAIKKFKVKANDCISYALRLPFVALIKKFCQLVTYCQPKFIWRPLKRHCPKAWRQRSCSETIPFVHEWVYCSFFGKLTKILVADVYISIKLYENIQHNCTPHRQSSQHPGVPTCAMACLGSHEGRKGVQVTDHTAQTCMMVWQKGDPPLGCTQVIWQRRSWAGAGWESLDAGAFLRASLCYKARVT